MLQQRNLEWLKLDMRKGIPYYLFPTPHFPPRLPSYSLLCLLRHITPFIASLSFLSVFSTACSCFQPSFYLSYLVLPLSNIISPTLPFVSPKPYLPFPHPHSSFPQPYILISPLNRLHHLLLPLFSFSIFRS